MADTPQEWLPILAKRLDDDLSRVRLLTRYTDGDAPLPEGGKNVKASWRKFQQESRTNWGLMIREAVADRVVPNGITIAGSADSAKAKQAQRIWRDNRMDSVFKDWIRYGLTTRQSFLTLFQGEGGAVITADSQETMVVSTDPLQPWRVRSALRVWRDLDVEKDFVVVWTDGARQKFSRDCYTGNNVNKRRLVRLVSGDWEPVGDQVDTGKPPPVTVYNNPGGFGEFEAHLDDINRINGGVLRRLTIEAMQAFRQRALKSAEGSGGLPKTDLQGNEIDYSKIFEPAPGALWDLPPGVDLWESQQTDIRPLLEGSRDDIRKLSSSTRTPLPMLMPDNANQTAAGATATSEGHLAKCQDRMAEAKVGITGCLVDALRLEGTELAEDETLEVAFEPVGMVSLSEKYAACGQVGVKLPWKSVARDVLGWSEQQISQADLELADEALTAGIFAAQQAPNTQQAPRSAPTA
jgi:hypothetical protein